MKLTFLTLLFPLIVFGQKDEEPTPCYTLQQAASCNNVIETDLKIGITGGIEMTPSGNIVITDGGNGIRINIVGADGTMSMCNPNNNSQVELRWLGTTTQTASFINKSGNDTVAYLSDIQRHFPIYPNDSMAGLAGLQKGKMYCTLKNGDLLLKVKK